MSYDTIRFSALLLPRYYSQAGAISMATEREVEILL